MIVARKLVLGYSISSNLRQMRSRSINYYRIPYRIPYRITNYTRNKARKLGVRVRNSTNRAKKLDVFDRAGKKVASVGARGMGDFPTFMRQNGAEHAKTRRRLYKMRHEKDRHIKGTRGWFADQLLW